MNSITKIGRAALTRLFNSACFRPQNKEDDLTITFCTTPFDLSQVIKEQYTHDHGSSFNSDMDYMVWGIELGLKDIEVDFKDPFSTEIIKSVIQNPHCPLPTHFIVHKWSNSDYGNSKSFIIFRLNEAQIKEFEDAREILNQEALEKAHGQDIDF